MTQAAPGTSLEVVGYPSVVLWHTSPDEWEGHTVSVFAGIWEQAHGLPQLHRLVCPPRQHDLRPWFEEGGEQWLLCFTCHGIAVVGDENCGEIA